MIAACISDSNLHYWLFYLMANIIIYYYKSRIINFSIVVRLHTNNVSFLWYFVQLYTVVTDSQYLILNGC